MSITELANAVRTALLSTQTFIRATSSVMFPYDCAQQHFQNSHSEAVILGALHQKRADAVQPLLVEGTQDYRFAMGILRIVLRSFAA